MSLHLIETLEASFAGLAQEAQREASVVVQFAAGDWAKIKAALARARQEMAEDAASKQSALNAAASQAAAQAEADAKAKEEADAKAKADAEENHEGSP